MRKFILDTGVKRNTHLLQMRCRMEYVSLCLVRQHGVYDDKGKFQGWVLTQTDIPLSSHGKHFLRQRGWPIPGKPDKCNLLYCQELTNNPVRRELN